MDKDLAVRLVQDFQQSEEPGLVKRDLEIVEPRSRKCVTVIGPRRAGKTSLLRHRALGLRDQGRAPTLYINLEDDRFFPPDLEDLDLVLRTFRELLPESADQKTYLFLDEVQLVNGWERFVRRVLDTENVQVYIAGSSSSLLRTEVASAMRGRSMTYVLLPFSFSEYLRARGAQVTTRPSSRDLSHMLSMLGEYLRYGGFPEVCKEPARSRHRVLDDYVDVMLMRDVIERHRVENIMVLRALYNALMSSVTTPFSLHAFHKYLKGQGHMVSKNTLYGYFSHLEDAFSVLAVRRFSHRLKETQQSLPKVYPIDTGYLAQQRGLQSRDMGILMECAVAVELTRRLLDDPTRAIYYWRDAEGREVDFAVTARTEVSELIQCSYDVSRPTTRDRELTPLFKASDELECDALRVITWDHGETTTVGGRTVVFEPLWRWLLGERGP